jgi:hypothetical protein
MVNTELIPVIHMLSEMQVSINVATCLTNGVKKIFLINHAVSSKNLLECATSIRNDYPNLWVGINVLGENPLDIISRDLLYDGLWIDETITSQIARYTRKFYGLLFSGLAFKYQPQPENLKEACYDAIRASDVAVTSGIGTGHAADVDKIKLIREYLGKHPMAIASGISIDNIHNYVGLADYLLVASSITDEDEIIIPAKLKELVNRIYIYENV